MQTTEIELAKAMEQIESLERWQIAQNGSLHELKEEIKELRKEVNGKLETVTEKINGTKNWLIATLTSSIVVLIALTANLMVGRP